MPFKPGHLIAGLTAAGTAVGLASLFPYAKKIKKDYDDSKKLEASIKSKVPKIAGVALTGATLAGAGGFAGGKAKWGTYHMLPEAQTKKEGLKQFGSAMFGRTGFEYDPSYAGSNGSLSREFYAKHSSIARFEMLDKLGLGWGSAAAIGGTLATGTAVGGYLLGKKILKPFHKENRRQLRRWQTVDKYLLPTALTAGVILGGVTGSAAGKASGKQQVSNYQHDMESAGNYYTNDSYNRGNSYGRPGVDFARPYMNEGKNNGRSQNY